MKCCTKKVILKIIHILLIRMKNYKNAKKNPQHSILLKRVVDPLYVNSLKFSKCKRYQRFKILLKTKIWKHMRMDKRI